MRLVGLLTSEAAKLCLLAGLQQWQCGIELASLGYSGGDRPGISPGSLFTLDQDDR